MQISQPSKIAEKWLSTQNLRTDLSFQEKKQFENPVLGCQDIKQKQSPIFFGTPCNEKRKKKIVEKEYENWFICIRGSQEN